MRISTLCVLAVVTASGLLAWSADAQMVPSSRVASSGAGSAGLITHVHEAEGRPTSVIVIDPQRRVMGVYHVIHETGEIQLKSIRNLAGDLQLRAYNSGGKGGGLTPDEIQEMLDKSP